MHAHAFGYKDMNFLSISYHFWKKNANQTHF